MWAIGYPMGFPFQVEESAGAKTLGWEHGGHGWETIRLEWSDGE